MSKMKEKFIREKKKIDELNKKKEKELDFDYEVYEFCRDKKKK